MPLEIAGRSAFQASRTHRTPPVFLGELAVGEEFRFPSGRRGVVVGRNAEVAVALLGVEPEDTEEADFSPAFEVYRVTPEPTPAFVGEVHDAMGLA